MCPRGSSQTDALIQQCEGTGGKTCCGFHFSFHPSANILSLSLSLQFLTRLLPLPVVFTVPPSFHNFLPAFARSPSTSLHPKPPLPPLSVSLPPSPPPLSLSLSMDNSSVFLRAAVCLPAYCDFHWDSFRDHSHLSWELEAWLWREINHSHLILTRIHKHTHTHT